jgi:hypothetical protein
MQRLSRKPGMDHIHAMKCSNPTTLRRTATPFSATS